AMTPEINRGFDSIKKEFGASSIERVERMLDPRKQERHPMQKQAKWVMPGISRKPWHDPYSYPEMSPIIQALEMKHAQIRAEFDRAWRSVPASFGSYQHYLVTRRDWKALYIFRRGELVRQTATLVPATYRIIDDLAVRPGKLCPLLESHFSTL